MNPKTLICGAGALGSRLTEHLARLGWTSLAVVDFDKVDRFNFASQSYLRHQTGQPKVNALGENVYRAVGQRLRIYHQSLSQGDGAKLLRWGDDAMVDLIVDCVDNQSGREAIQELARRHDVPCLHIGLNPQGYAEIVWDEDFRALCEASPDRHGTGFSHETLALLAVAVASRVLEDFADTQRRLNFRVQAGNLAIMPLDLKPEAVRAPETPHPFAWQFFWPSFIVPGLGQLCSGHGARALTFFAAAMGFLGMGLSQRANLPSWPIALFFNGLAAWDAGLLKQRDMPKWQARGAWSVALGLLLAGLFQAYAP
jgi:hypothetical protein